MGAGRLLTLLIAAAITIACSASRDAPPRIAADHCPAAALPPSAAPFRLSFLADFVVPFAGRATGLEFGGLSGLAFDREAGIWVGVSDDRYSPRWFSLSVAHAPGGLRVDIGPPVLAETSDQRPMVPSMLDLESVALLSNGDLLMASEGDLADGVRHRHAVVRYTRDGRFVSEVPLPAHYHGDPDGAAPQGLRGNLGFEGMTSSPDGGRTWLAAENPLAQDDGRPTMDAGARTRLLELVEAGDAFVPAREFVYEIAPSGRPAALGPDAVLVDQGVVALLWLTDSELLSMERAFLRDGSSGLNVVRLFRIDLRGAGDVSGMASLADHPPVRPVGKTLLLDLADIVHELRPSLARLDNFEAMAWGPLLPDGTRTILLAADDNFAARQQNAFVLLALREP